LHFPSEQIELVKLLSTCGYVAGVRLGTAGVWHGIFWWITVLLHQLLFHQRVGQATHTLVLFSILTIGRDCS
jgi:hypothetical protein